MKISWKFASKTTDIITEKDKTKASTTTNIQGLLIETKRKRVRGTRRSEMAKNIAPRRAMVLIRDWEKNSTEESAVSCARFADLKKLCNGQDISIAANFARVCTNLQSRSWWTKITPNGVLKPILLGRDHWDEVSGMEDPVVFALIKWLILPDPLENAMVVSVWGWVQGLKAVVIQQQGIWGSVTC
jgi:hypothetical protein